MNNIWNNETGLVQLAVYPLSAEETEGEKNWWAGMSTLKLFSVQY